MVAVAFTFPFGRYHATAWGTSPNEAEIDWPPSPWRILRALVAAGRDGDEWPAVERALQALLAAGDPVYELPATNAAHTRHYMPLDKLDQGAWKTTLIVDAFMALAPDAELRVFWDVELGEAERAALDAAARRAGYIGRSESLCDARLLPADAIPTAPGAWPEELTMPDLPAAEGVVTLMSVMRGQEVALLETDVTAMRKEKRLIPEGTQRVRYATVASPARHAVLVGASEAPTLAVLRIAGNALPDITRAVVVATVLRSALQRRFDPDSTGRTSPVLSGHVAGVPSKRQHRHAHYLALPDATGARIDRIAVWAPDGLGPEELRALASLESLRVRELPEPVRLSLVSVGPAEQALGGYSRAATAWETVTPMVLPRHIKPGRERDTPEAQLLAELAHRELPAPVAIEEIRGAWGRFARDRPGQRQQRTKTAIGFRMRFDEPVPGPIVLGANCHFGLGLMRPVT